MQMSTLLDCFSAAAQCRKHYKNMHKHAYMYIFGCFSVAPTGVENNEKLYEQTDPDAFREFFGGPTGVNK